ncbi:MAG: hypothetical protein IJV65_04235 [Kiritimatiellae bacterium]|nr:hypothetical protein [Kiritimatiellia bacterium]
MRLPRLRAPRPRPVFAGFALGLRAPLRSKFVFALLALLGAAVLLLPIQLRGDGTDAGALRMLLTWTLGVAVSLLSVATLWAGCAAVSGDVEGKRHAGAAVSSARPFELWLGRWLGLAALDAAVLALVLLATFVQVRARGLGPDATAVRAYLPLDPASFEEEAERVLEDAIARMPPAARPDGDPARRAAMLESVRRDLAGDSYLPLDPGRERRWRFELPWAGERRRLREGDRADFEFSFMSSYGDQQGVRGLLRLLAGDGREIVRRDVTTDDNGFFRIPLDTDAIVVALKGGGTLEAVFENAEGDGGAAVLLRHDRAARVSVPAGGLAGNLFVAFFALLALLSLLAALGLACGCALSFPVAAFAATALCAMVAVSGGGAFADDADAHGGHSHGSGPGAVVAAIQPCAKAVARALSSATEPFDRAEALDRLGDGVAVSARGALRALLLDGLVLPLLLGLLGAAALRGRELP